MCMLKLAVHSSQPNPVPLVSAPKESFWPSCAVVWTSALSHHIGPPLLLSAQVVASHSDVFLGPFEACRWGGSLAPRQNGLLSGDQGTR